jgi:Kef-type K+ transport system membrane component KefB
MNTKHLQVYLITILPLLAASGLILWLGHGLHAMGAATAAKEVAGSGNILVERFHHPLAMLLLQILVVLALAKCFGYLFKLLGQQSVIGEIAAGIVLGPSLLGWLWNDAYVFLFPPSSLGNLHLISQLGLILFMFIIGMELKLDNLRSKASQALVVSHVSILLPYLLGIGLAYFIYADFAPSNISFTAYALFMGIAMSITALPVLARILKERNMLQSPVGNMAIICAAFDDVSAWFLLALVICIAKAGDLSNAIITITLTLVYILAMIYLVKPLLQKAAKRFCVNDQISPVYVAIIFLTLIFSALLTEAIGVHALFGAFLAGVIMPDTNAIRKQFSEKLEDVSVLLLLPLFFAFSGLKTQIGLLNSSYLWLICGAIILLAIIGKFAGSAIAAKLVGQSWKDSLSIGALMNTRGLMQLIVLNIGLDLGILSPEIFTMMVFMALVTTAMTSPLLNMIERFTSKSKV